MMLMMMADLLAIVLMLLLLLDEQTGSRIGTVGDRGAHGRVAVASVGGGAKWLEEAATGGYEWR